MSRRNCLHSFSNICLRNLQFSLQSILKKENQTINVFTIWCSISTPLIFQHTEKVSLRPIYVVFVHYSVVSPEIAFDVFLQLIYDLFVALFDDLTAVRPKSLVSYSGSEIKYYLNSILSIW